MNTRNVTRQVEKVIIKKIEYEVNIDFDEASAAWKANKKSTGNGCYKYICEHQNKNGKKCTKNPMTGFNFCNRHNFFG